MRYLPSTVPPELFEYRIAGLFTIQQSRIVLGKDIDKMPHLYHVNKDAKVPSGR